MGKTVSFPDSVVVERVGYGGLASANSGRLERQLGTRLVTRAKREARFECVNW
jgi:hypothetical protein